MGPPERTRDEFEARLRAAGVGGLPAGTLDALLAHHRELRRWAPTIDLVGPGAVEELPERHYAEALAALPLLPERPFRLLDLGSGAGFPGFVLAAARPDAEVWLVEARERRASFLAAAVRKAKLGVRVVAGRVAPGSHVPLPAAIDVITVRALRLERPLLRAVAPHLAPGAQLLRWTGQGAPRLPPEWEPGAEVALPASRGRAIRQYLWRGAAG
jgi:16S rRNA (guanine527-N7)-methyltransferase